MNLEKFADDLKKKSQTTRIIIASLRHEIIDIADKTVTMQE